LVILVGYLPVLLIPNAGAFSMMGAMYTYTVAIPWIKNMAIPVVFALSLIVEVSAT
jgi:hypothetical protein